MKNFDLKHIAFHILVGIYFIWLAVFSILLYIALNNELANSNLQLARVLLIWVCLNFIMGTSVFIVLQLFRNRTLVSVIIRYTYVAVTIAAVLTAFFIMSRV